MYANIPWLYALEMEELSYAKQGQYLGNVKKTTIILEAVASLGLWIWHSLFVMPGSYNDINVLQRFPLCARLTVGRTPCNYNINGRDYNTGYNQIDGIYPLWATIAKTIFEPSTHKRAHFAQR